MTTSDGIDFKLGTVLAINFPTSPLFFLHRKIKVTELPNCTEMQSGGGCD